MCGVVHPAAWRHGTCNSSGTLRATIRQIPHMRMHRASTCLLYAAVPSSCGVTRACQLIVPAAAAA